MTALSLERELNVSLDAAREAARVVMDVYATRFDVEMKDAHEPVTLADMRSNALLCERLAAAFPNDGIVAEESVPEDAAVLAEVRARHRVWFVDPLDGTKEFVGRNGEFAVMIGLTIDGVSVLGVVALPAFGEIAVGVVGQGAWVEASDGTRTALRVSCTATIAECSQLLSRSHRPERLLRVSSMLNARRQVACGSVGMKAVRIARGMDDLYVYPPAKHGARLWDACGPEAIVRAAGGRVTDANGDAMDYRAPELPLVRGMVASNGLIHDEVMLVLKAEAALAAG